MLSQDKRSPAPLAPVGVFVDIRGHGEELPRPPDPSHVTSFVPVDPGASYRRSRGDSSARMSVPRRRKKAFGRDSAHSVVYAFFLVVAAGAGRRHDGHLRVRQREFHVTSVPLPGALILPQRLLLGGISRGRATQLADLGVDLFRFWRRRGWQRRQAVPHFGIRRIHVRTVASLNLEHARRDGALHLLPGRRRRLTGQVRVGLQAGVAFRRPHADLRSYREREGRRFLGRVPALATLRYPRDPVEEAVVVAGAAAVAPVAYRRSLDVLQALLQAL